MERLNEMLNTLEERMTERVEERQKQLTEAYHVQKEQILDAIREMQVLAEEKQAEVLVISWLRSSYVTGSNKFKLACYETEPFVEEEPVCRFYGISAFFKFVDDDIQSFRQHLEKQYIRILKSEMEEIRRTYMERLYRKCMLFFQMAVDAWKVQSEVTGIKVFYGEEMGELMQIGNL